MGNKTLDTMIAEVSNLYNNDFRFWTESQVSKDNPALENLWQKNYEKFLNAAHNLLTTVLFTLNTNCEETFSVSLKGFLIACGKELRHIDSITTDCSGQIWMTDTKGKQYDEEDLSVDELNCLCRVLVKRLYA